MLETGASTVALMEPTVLFFMVWKGSPAEREQQARNYLARLRYPRELTRVKVEMSRVGLQFEADTRHFVWEVARHPG